MNLKPINLKNNGDEYVPFDPADYVDNSVALARIKAGRTQEQLAKLLKVSQAYIDELEQQQSVTPELLAKINSCLVKVKKTK